MNFCFFTSLRKQQFILVHKDVAPGETATPQQQKVQTDGVKAVANLVMSSNWSVGSYIVLAIVYEWQTNEQKTAKVKCQRNKYITKLSILEECILL